MGDAERLLRRAGAERIPARRHIVYLLQGERFTLHRGTRTDDMELQKVKKRLRKLGLLERGK